jgi:hypothetical protein
VAHPVADIVARPVKALLAAGCIQGAHSERARCSCHYHRLAEKQAT